MQCADCRASCRRKLGALNARARVGNDLLWNVQTDFGTLVRGKQRCEAFHLHRPRCHQVGVLVYACISTGKPVRAWPSGRQDSGCHSMSADGANRTLVLSVVSVDLVGYSRQSVASQMSLKDKLNQVLLEAIRDISVADRIILDTGDGVAIGFLGDPEDALYVAMFMREGIARSGAGNVSGRSVGDVGSDAIRVGVNLGPVKLSTGVGGHPNIIGDGINVAERIMSFAEPGQVTASRPFFEVMSRVSSQYASLFRYIGPRTDKQVRAHDVYLVGKSSLAFLQAETGVAGRSTGKQTNLAVPAAAEPVARKAPAALEYSASNPVADTIERHAGLIDFLGNRKKVATTATTLTVVALVLATLLGYRKMATAPPIVNVLAGAAVGAAPVGVDSSATTVPSPPAVAIAATEPAKAATPKLESKSAVSAPPAAKPRVVESKPTIVPVVPAATVPSPTPAKIDARVPPPAVGPATADARDKPKDTKADKSERAGRTEKSSTREDARSEPSKPIAPRKPVEREQSAPVGAVPLMPAYQSPVQVPRQDSVAPTPSLPAPVAPRVDTV